MDIDGIGFVEAVVIDVGDLNQAMVFWSHVIGEEFGPSFEPTFRRAKLASGLAIVLQQVSEAKTGKNRMHIDIEVPDLEEGLKRIEAIGGRMVSRADNKHGSHIVCADPDGNEFCLG